LSNHHNAEGRAPKVRRGDAAVGVAAAQVPGAAPRLDQRARLAGVGRYVIHHHGTYEDRWARMNPLLRRREFALTRRAGAVIAVSETVAAMSTARLGLKPGQVVTIVNGIDVERYRRNDEARAAIRSGDAAPFDVESRVIKALERLETPSLRRVINATGVMTAKASLDDAVGMQGEVRSKLLKAGTAGFAAVNPLPKFIRPAGCLLIAGSLPLLISVLSAAAGSSVGTESSPARANAAETGLVTPADLRLVPFPKRVVLGPGQCALGRKLVFEVSESQREPWGRLLNLELGRAGLRAADSLAKAATLAAAPASLRRFWMPDLRLSAARLSWSKTFWT